MGKKEFVKFLNELFNSYGFKKKGNNWSTETDLLKKFIDLQKSNFGNYYYINYGWTIKSLENSGIEHVSGRLASLDNDDNKRIDQLLDLDKNINEDERKVQLHNLIVPNLLEKLQSINREDELFFELMKRPHLNDVPLVVKKHFNLA